MKLCKKQNCYETRYEGALCHEHHLERARNYYYKHHPVAHRHIKDGKAELRQKFGVVKIGAKSRNLEFKLTFEEYEQIIKNTCYYCEGTLPVYGGGLDRINNKEGYYLDNVLPCCALCNKFRNDILTVDEMKFVVTQLKAYRAGTIK
jgi:hypothetical protein